MAIQKVDKEEQERIKRFIDKRKDSAILFDEIQNGLRYVSGEMNPPNERSTLDLGPNLKRNDIKKFRDWIVSHITQNPYALDIEPKEDDPFDNAIAVSLQEDIDHAINSPEGREAIECAFTTQTTVGYGYVAMELSHPNKRVMDQYPTPISIKLPQNVWVGLDDSIDGSGAKEMAFHRDMDRDYAEQLIGKDKLGIEKYADWQRSMFRSLKWNSSVVPDITFLYIKEKSRTQYHDSNGKIVEEKQNNGYSREVVDSTVCISRYIGSHRYEKTEYAGDRLPCSAFRGSTNYRSDLGDAEYGYSGLYQICHDYQEALLYLYNEAIDIASRNSKAPWIGYEGTLEGREDEFQNSNTNGVNLLLVKPINIGGQILPLPQRMNNQGDVEWILSYAREVYASMEQAIGINAQTMGMTEGIRETAKASELRGAVGGMTVSLYLDNCEKSIQNLGKIVADLAIHARPKRLIKFTPKDSEEEQEVEIDLNELGVNSADFIYRPTQGPANESKRQAEFNWLMSIGVSSPEMFEQMSDLIIKRSNSVANTEIVERARDIIKMKYPNLIQEDGQTKEDPEAVAMAEQLTAQMEQMRAMYEQLLMVDEQKSLLINQLQTELQKNEAQAVAKVIDRQLQEDGDTARTTQDNITKLMEAKIKEGQAVDIEVIKQMGAMQQKELEMVKSAIETSPLQEESATNMRSPVKGGIVTKEQGQNLDIEDNDENEEGNLEATQ